MRKKMNMFNLELSRLKITYGSSEEAKMIMGQRRTKSMPNRKPKPLHFFNERGASGKDLKTSYRKPANTDILYGRDFDDEVTAIEQIESPLGVVINGMIRSIETREIRNERTILSIVVTDLQTAL